MVNVLEEPLPTSKYHVKRYCLEEVIESIMVEILGMESDAALLNPGRHKGKDKSEQTY